MKYLVVAEYPYVSIKKFFASSDEALNFLPDPFIEWPFHRILAKRVYELEKYSESERGINFAVLHPAISVSQNKFV